MNKEYLLDTNILIYYYFNGQLAVQPTIEEIRTGNAVGFYCPITWIELLCYPSLSEIEANKMRQFLKNLIFVPLTESILDCATQIRRDYRLMLEDALIAAYTVITRYTLVTRNVDDFKRVDSLILLNPFD